MTQNRTVSKNSPCKATLWLTGRKPTILKKYEKTHSFIKLVIVAIRHLTTQGVGVGVGSFHHYVVHSFHHRAAVTITLTDIQNTLILQLYIVV